jgi:hypothetical protein
MLQEQNTERQHLQVGWAVPASGAHRARWEYLSIHTDSDAETVTAVRGNALHLESGASIVAALETLGADDWELVSVTPRTAGGFLYVFKRPAATR